MDKKQAADFEILIVEDNDTMRMGMEVSLRREGYTVYSFGNPQKALDFFNSHPIFIVISDLRMEPFDGIHLMKEIKRVSPNTETLLISAYATIESAIEAMKLGAIDFLTKPFSPDELRVRVRKISEKLNQDRRLLALQEKNRLLEEDLALFSQELIGQSEGMQRVFRMINTVAEEDSSVLIQGESGTGKELVARAIHHHSHRNHQPFIRVNCAALNDNLLESELFGHEKGAFTGAIKARKGRFELAHQGTLFLDEIGDISPLMQVKLLRVLQEQEFERVGGEKTLSVDVRMIFATNRRLQQEVADGKFRQDLYYRICVIPIDIPPLRERIEDISILVRYFLTHLAGTRPERQKKITSQVMELLQNYTWPGNVRELQNMIERLYVISPGSELSYELTCRQLCPPTLSSPAFPDDSTPLDDALFQFEKQLIEKALKKTGGNKNRAAKTLSIRTSALYYKLEKFGLI